MSSLVNSDVDFLKSQSGQGDSNVRSYAETFVLCDSSCSYGTLVRLRDASPVSVSAAAGQSKAQRQGIE